MAVVRRLSELAGAQAPAGGGNRQVLRHSDGVWLRAAGGADELVTHLGPVRSELATAHEGLNEAAGQLAALAELAAVRESWERRIQVARGECGSLADSLRTVARAQGVTDEAVSSSFVPVAGRGGEER